MRSISTLRTTLCLAHASHHQSSHLLSPSIGELDVVLSGGDLIRALLLVSIVVLAVVILDLGAARTKEISTNVHML